MQLSFERMAVLAEGVHVVDTHVSVFQGVALAVYVVGILLFDQFVLNRHPRELTWRESLFQALFFVACHIVFGLVISVPNYGWDGFRQYLGVLTAEYSLSIDNLFILMIILARCRIPREYHQKALFWGINVAIAIRVLFIFGIAGIAKAELAMAFVAAYMIYTGFKQVIGKEKDVTERWSYRLLTKIMPVTYRSYGGKLFIRQGGKVVATLLFLAMCLIGSTDGWFALDSIPTAWALSNIMFLMMAGNINGVLGLRPIYFLMGHITKHIRRIAWGLTAICIGVGAKLLLAIEPLMHVFGWKAVHIPLGISFGWIAASLGFAFIAGLIWPPKHAVDLNEVTSRNSTMVHIYLDCGRFMTGEWESRLLHRHLPELVREALAYDTTGNVPMFGFAGHVEPYATVISGEKPEPPERKDDMAQKWPDLAVALRHAKEIAERVTGLHVNIILTTGVTVDQGESRRALGAMPKNSFTLFVRVSDEPGGAEHLDELNHLFGGEDDRCDTLHATDDHGQPKDNIAQEIGRQLDEFLHRHNALHYTPQAAH